ncbi:cobalamin B12-binding domain-containing protein [Candidatus Woesearchaeota archaeon]|nr:cobalamin B12-binding domain-containing protein [Candidatus Woesearchaeota archaeon]
MRKDKVTLVQPPLDSAFGIGIPLGLLTLATALEQTGITPYILDFALEIFSKRLTINHGGLDFCVEAILKTEPKVIGFNIQCASLPIVLAIIKRLKKYTSAKIVLGGPQSLAFVDQDLASVQNMLHIDCIFRVFCKASG